MPLRCIGMDVRDHFQTSRRLLGCWVRAPRLVGRARPRPAAAGPRHRKQAALAPLLAIGAWLVSARRGARGLAADGHGRQCLSRAGQPLTIGTVTQGPFEDYIAVRGAVAPFIIDYLTTDQGGTVKQVLVEDGAMVKSGQPLIILSNPALQLQVAAQQLTFEQTRFKYRARPAGYRTPDQQAERRPGARQDPAGRQRHRAQHLSSRNRKNMTTNVKLRAATIASRDVEQQVRATQLTGGMRPGTHVDVANAGVEALTIRAPMDGQLTALDADVGQSKAAGRGAGPGQFRRSFQADRRCR